jgi:iron complex transport system substrate-binding protein
MPRHGRASMLQRQAVNVVILTAFISLPLGGAMLGFRPPVVARSDAPNSIKIEAQLPSQLFATPAQRVLIYPLVLDAYLTLDDGPVHIKGASKPALDWARRAGFQGIYPAIESILSIGNSLGPTDAEMALLLQPDAVLSWPQLAQPLRQAGLPNLVEVPSGIENESTTWHSVAKVSGRLGRAEDILARQEQDLHDLQTTVSRLSAVPSKFVIFGGGNGTQYIAGRRYYLTKKLEFVGLQNATQIHGPFDLERLMALNPDVLFLDGALNTDLPQTFYRTQAWSALRAVRNHRVYKMPIHSLSNGPLYDPILLRWMAELLFPNTMTSAVRKEIRHVYNRVYCKKFDEDQINEYLLMSANIQSANYDRFKPPLLSPETSQFK